MRYDVTDGGFRGSVFLAATETGVIRKATPLLKLTISCSELAALAQKLPYNGSDRMVIGPETSGRLCLEQQADTSQHDRGHDRLYSECQSEWPHATGAQAVQTGSQPHSREAQQKRPAIKMIQIIDCSRRPEMKAGQGREHNQAKGKLGKVFHQASRGGDGAVGQFLADHSVHEVEQGGVEKQSPAQLGDGGVVTC